MSGCAGGSQSLARLARPRPRRLPALAPIAPAALTSHLTPHSTRARTLTRQPITDQLWSSAPITDGECRPALAALPPHTKRAGPGGDIGQGPGATSDWSARSNAGL